MMNSQYFCTAGRGTECFLVEELISKGATHVQQLDGKVLFHCKDKHENLLETKTAERLFIQVYFQKDSGLTRKKGLHQVSEMVRQINTWPDNLSMWRLFQSSSEKEKMTKTESDSEETLVKRQKLDINHQVTFRISCKCSGNTGRMFSLQQWSRALGVAIAKSTGWKTDLKRPELEIYVQINDEHLIIGLPLTKSPLSKRSYIRHIGLRSTVSWILCSLSGIAPFDVILDPMCGTGTILMEAQHSWPKARYCGVDISASQLKKAFENKQLLPEPNNIELLMGDVRCLPLKTGCVDVIICDIPFGFQHCSQETVVTLYPVMLSEMNRVLKIGGRVVLLTSSNFKDLVVNLVSNTCDQKEVGLGKESVHQKSSTANNLLNVNTDSEKNETLNTDSNSTGINIDIGTADSHLENTNNPDNVSDKIKLSSGPMDKSNYIAWTLMQSNYLKLGETHAQILVFTKAL